ncbi:MAG: NfeD family protein [Candidatus Marinimicrobia bacterium]|jgi:membrane protein implicated in regulation of membrane protease activity|nr:NfeD family protein [Candidatus Neomarinimicrobiota bacterium]
MKGLFTPELIWFLIGLAMLLLEFVIPGIFVMFFGLGAWIVAFLCLVFDFSLNLQLVVFILSSVMLIFLLRKKLSKIFIGKTSSPNIQGDIEEFLGQKATVVHEIRPNIPGKVMFHGTEWEAEANVEIATGVVVTITGRDSIILKVKPIEGEKS